MFLSCVRRVQGCAQFTDVAPTRFRHRARSRTYSGIADERIRRRFTSTPKQLCAPAVCLRNADCRPRNRNNRGKRRRSCDYYFRGLDSYRNRGGGGGTGGPGGGSYRIFWDTSNNSIGGLDTITDPAVAAALCLAMDQALAANGCESVPPPSPPNGCGPVAGFAPPQGVGDANFNFACTSHDICYSTLAAGKSGCDGRFWDDLVAECQRAYWDNVQLMRETQHSDFWVQLAGALYALQLTCITAGNVYAGGVAIGGGGRYASAQASARCQSFRDAKAGLGCGNG